MNKKANYMPTIGVVGVTIPGAVDCINKMNQYFSEHFDNYSHPNTILHQLNFSPTHDAQNMNRWDIVEDRLMESIHSLTKAGVDFFIIPANTVHKVIGSIQLRATIPIISILDVVTAACEDLNLKKVGIILNSPRIRH